jgi:acyl carrier protein
MPLNEELRQFVTDNFLFGKNNGRLADTDSFLDKGIIDSTGVLELVAFLEERYGIHVQDRDLIPENLDSIENLERFIGNKLPRN